MAFFKRKKKDDAKPVAKPGIPPLKEEVDKKEKEAKKEKPGVPPLKSEVKEPMAVKEKEVGKKKETKKVLNKGRKIAHEVLVKPLITEKATALSAENKYAFAVGVKANKVEIKKAIQELYGVSPIAVNIINLRGRKVRQGRIEGQTKAWKKAIVTLKQGETIKVHDV